MSELKTATDLQNTYRAMLKCSDYPSIHTNRFSIELIERIDTAETWVKELEHRIEGLIDKYEGCPHTVDCGCAQDKPSDICAHHAPQLRKALAENERLDKQIARFLEPVSDEERRVANHWTGCWTKDEVEALIANRMEPKGENDGK